MASSSSDNGEAKSVSSIDEDVWNSDSFLDDVDDEEEDVVEEDEATVDVVEVDWDDVDEDVDWDDVDEDVAWDDVDEDVAWDEVVFASTRLIVLGFWVVVVAVAVVSAARVVNTSSSPKDYACFEGRGEIFSVVVVVEAAAAASKMRHSMATWLTDDNSSQVCNNGMSLSLGLVTQTWNVKILQCYQFILKFQ